MGFHPLKARLTGQFLLLDLSTPKGALHFLVNFPLLVIVHEL